MTWTPWPPQKSLLNLMKARPPRVLYVPVGGYEMRIEVDPLLAPGTIELRGAGPVVRMVNVGLPEGPTRE